MNKWLVRPLALALLLVATFGRGEPAPAVPGNGEASPAAPDREELLAAPPPGWQLFYQFNNERTRITEFIPPGESVDDWNRKISFESYTDQPDADPIDTLLGEAAIFDKECKVRQHFNLYTGLENGYQTSTRLIMCTEHKQTGGGAVRMMKAIKGDVRFYIIALTKKVPAFEPNQPEMSKEEIAGWAGYLRMIELCDRGNPAHPCPATDPKAADSD